MACSTAHFGKPQQTQQLAWMHFEVLHVCRLLLCVYRHLNTCVIDILLLAWLHQSKRNHCEDCRGQSWFIAFATMIWGQCSTGKDMWACKSIFAYVPLLQKSWKIKIWHDFLNFFEFGMSHLLFALVKSMYSTSKILQRATCALQLKQGHFKFQ